MTPPTSLDDCLAKTGEPATDHICHCEERSDVAIPWQMVRFPGAYQEIATPSARNDRSDLQLVLLIYPDNHPS